ncbi:MAG: polyphosphate kinase 1 [Cytophagales bacterium]|nr:polyphosphate kinase 1 [Cytophagales bacterium]
MARQLTENELIDKSKFISRDLSWLRFNERVLNQAQKNYRTVLEKLKFLAITASNLDEFMMIRVGSLYNYLDYDRDRVDYCGLHTIPFKKRLFTELQDFTKAQEKVFQNELIPKFKVNGFQLVKFDDLSVSDKRKTQYYFSKTVYPMLTPMVYDALHTYPMLVNKVLTLGVVTEDPFRKGVNKYSFVQIPKNLPRFYELERDGKILLLPIEDLITAYLHKLYKNIKIISTSLFRVTRNGDFDYDDYDESENDFVEEIQEKLKGRKTGRVVRVEVQKGYDKTLLDILIERYELEKENIFISKFLDYTSLWQIVKLRKLSHLLPKMPKSVKPLFVNKRKLEDNIFEHLKEKDLCLHHPYQSMDTLIHLLEESAEDPDVLAIKITIYRLAEDSRVSKALLRAAENGKHVSVLFEVKARFDEENNINEGQKLQKAGCYVIYGIDKVKTHTKLLMIVRKDKKDIVRYVHMSSGNYNESTAKLYTDTSFITTQRVYGNDVSEFFNVITGHSLPSVYKKLITTPGDMRKKLISLIRKEISFAKKGLKAGVIIKVNSLQDKDIIEALYSASRAGVKVKLIVRGICSIRPKCKGLSENIEIKSIVGDYLEHSRIFYFHNDGDPKVYGGSADVMVRSFDKRIESLFMVTGDVQKQFMAILDYNLKDEVNSYYMNEDGSYSAVKVKNGEGFNTQYAFFKLKEKDLDSIKLV